MEKKIRKNKVYKRILELSPTVREGLERECCKEDFYSESNKAIGKGGFGQVWKVRHKVTNKIYVIKVIGKQNIIEQKMTEQINREIEIMYKLNHPHIIKLFNHFEDDDYLYLIMHYASKGQLYNLLKKQKKIDEKNAAQFMREIISAVKYLHSFNPPIIHRDIKPENILLDENNRVKLADFGWSNYLKEKQELRNTYCGTPEYLAPEMVKKEGHNTSLDIWDLGVLMFELLCGKPPFQGKNYGELFTNIKKHRINWPNNFPPLAKNLINMILKPNPKERLTLDQILSHSWFEKNPQLRPVLTPSNITERQWLESHIINKPIAENEKNEIKGTSVINMIKKINNNNLNINGNNNNNNKNEENKNDNLININNEIEIIKKENNELKTKLEKKENDIKLLKNEINQLNNPTLKLQTETTIQNLKNELEKYKLSSDKIKDLYIEIDKKSVEILELKNKLDNTQLDYDKLKKDYSNLNDKYNNEKIEKENIENSYNEIKNRLITQNQKNEEIFKNIHPKINIIENNNNKKFKNFNNNNENEINLILEKLNESFNEVLNNVKKTNILEKLINAIKQNNDNNNNFVEIFEKENKLVLESIEKIRNKFEEKENDIKKNILDSNNNKVNEWYTSKINELMPFKIKSDELEITLKKNENNLKILNEKFEIQNNNCKYLENIIKEKDKLLNDKNNYINQIENKIGNIKNFIFQYCEDKIILYQNVIKN